jgi:hypothetical protein
MKLRRKMEKECIANKQAIWRLQHAMRFIKEEPKQENPNHGCARTRSI